jgi:hypothetical protein
MGTPSAPDLEGRRAPMRMKTELGQEREADRTQLHELLIEEMM